MTYKLRIKDEDGKSTLVPMTVDQITVGRKEGNTIRLTERNVSRDHARILKEDGKIFVEDMSRYGTRVNGHRIKGEKKKVEPGDVVIIGDYEFSLEGGAKAAPAPKPEPPKPKKKSKRVGGPSGDTAMISLDEIAKRERAAGKRRVDADVATLFIVNTDLKGTEIPINGDELILGRTADADIQVNHTSISAEHARLTNEGGKFRIEDLGSSNGLKINGEYYEGSVLRRGDMLELGHVKMRFIEAGEVWVYKPEAFEEGVDWDDDEPKKSGKGLWLFLTLALLAGGIAAVYFLYLNQDTSVLETGGTSASAGTSTGAAGATATADAGAAGTKVEPGMAGAADAGPETAAVAEDTAVAEKDEGTEPEVAVAAVDAGPEVQAESPAQKHVDQGEEYLKKEKWDDAIKAFNAGLKADANSEDSKTGLAKARSEKAVLDAYNSIKKKVARKDLEGAWEEAKKVPEPGEGSVYDNRYSALLKGVRLSYLKELIDDGDKQLRSKRNQQALDLANKALDIDDDNSKAKSLKSKALRAIKKERQSASANKKPDKKPDKQPDTKKPDTKKPDSSSGASAKDLYREGRRLLSAGSRDAALAKFQQAASKGYSKAYKLMGNIYLQKGQTSKAKAAYKKYLRLRPGASDAEAISDTIKRLGG